MGKILSFFILFFAANLFSQQYVPLLQEGNKWYEIDIEYNFDLSSPLSKTYVIINGEETINGIVYKKLYKNLYCYTPDKFFPCDPTGNSDEFYKLVREDLGERKVYFYDDISNADILLYNFSLNVGDLIPWNFPFYAQNSNANPNGDLAVVNIVQNGKAFDKSISKTFLADNNSYNNYQFSTKIYEGIGSNIGLLYRPGQAMFEGGHFLQCFENTASGKSCDYAFLSSKESVQNLPFHLIRDKNKGSFKLVGKSNKNFELKFYDFSGKLLESKKVNSNEEFYLNNVFQSGTYIYNLTSATEYLNGKIVVP